MSFDLYVWPVDGPITYRQASKALDRMLDQDAAGPIDGRLMAFQLDLQGRFPEAFPDLDSMDEDWQPALGDVFFELDEAPGHVFLGIPFSCVARVGEAVQEIAAKHDLIVFDPQAEAVYLPPAFGGTAVDWGTDPSPEELAAQQAAWMEESMAAAAGRAPVDEDEIHLEMLRSVTASGGEMWTPMGYQLTEENILETMADPNRTPSSMQTPAHKAQLIADLQSKRRAVRNVAVSQLCGWDPDPDVAAALVPLLRSDDDFYRWMAATGLARQGATDALDEVLEVVRRASPQEGGSDGAMLLPVRAALELAERIGPSDVDRAKALMRGWRGPAPAKLPRHAREWAAELDELLA